jgi:hypothetical protein
MEFKQICNEECFGCANNINPSFFIYRNRLETDFMIQKSRSAKSLRDIKAQLKENWNIIAKYEGDLLSRDAALLAMENVELLLKLTKFDLYPCMP